MDYHRDTRTNLWTFPRGARRTDGLGGELSWKSTYGSLAASAYDLMTTDGVNERHLAAHLLWLTESEYGPRDERRPALTVAVWLQYVLDNFATVAEAVAWVEASQMQIVPQADPATGTVAALHLGLEDATGDSAIIEYVAGHPRIWHGRQYTVLTNSPPYDQQLRQLPEFTGFGGDRPLPGGTDATDRFARAAYYTDRLPAPGSQLEAVASLLSVLRNASQPFRRPDPDTPDPSITRWRTVADLTHGLYVYESASRPVTVWARLAALPLSEDAPTTMFTLVDNDPLTGVPSGDITEKFVATDPMRFLPG